MLEVKKSDLGNIHILRLHIFGLNYVNPPTHYVSINTVLNISKNGHFLNPPTQSDADVIMDGPLLTLNNIALHTISLSIFTPILYI